MIHPPTFFAVTGGPGAGKTTLLRQLQVLGETVVPESARAVIRAEIRRTGVRPQGERFWRLTLAADVAAFHAAAGRAFFDRSLVDSWATARMGGLPCPEADVAVQRFRYNRRAFIAPPWREIYVQDAERIQTWAQAIASYEACHAAYEAAGYELVELPRTDVARRAGFALEAARDA
jgi:predicted ATPase